MVNKNEAGKSGLKAVILAAGAKSITEDGSPLLLQPLGTRKVIDYVMENVGQLVPPEDTIVVVGYQREALCNDFIG